MNRTHIIALCTLVFSLASPIAHSAQNDREAAWEALRQSNAIAIMRHALAPGTSDPANFDVNDCATQRNLSDKGRAQSQAIGELFKSQGIETAQIFSSEWCRCQDTATLLGLGNVEPLPALNSFFEDRSSSASQTAAVMNLLPQWLEPGSSPTILVTHQVNISALTNTPTSSGEILIITMEADKVVVLDSIKTL